MKEVIYLDAGRHDDDPYVHCCMYEKEYEYEGDIVNIFGEEDKHRADHFMVILFTKNNFSGKVKMTLESIEDDV